MYTGVSLGWCIDWCTSGWCIDWCTSGWCIAGIPWWVYLGGVYASLCILGRVYLPVHSLPVHRGRAAVDASSAGMCSSVRGVEEARLYPEERVLSHLRNKPPSWRKQAPFGRETRYRKHSRTRRREIPQPLHNCSQTPLGDPARLITRFTVGRIPGPWPPDLD